MSDAIRIGVAGLKIGGWHVESFQKNPQSCVTAVCDLDAARLADVGERNSVPTRLNDWRALVERPDVDAVSVCLPNFLHKPVAVAALQAGKHVLIEKPMAMNPAEGEEILAAARSAGRTAMVAMKMRYAPEAALVRSIITSGRIGSVYYGSNCLIGPYKPAADQRPWFLQRSTAGGGALFDNGVHLLDMHWYLAGRPKPTEAMGLCFAMGAKGGMVDPDNPDCSVEDFGVGIVRFCDGTAILNETAWRSHSPGAMGLRIYGTQGGISLWPHRILVEKDGKDVEEPFDLASIQAEDQFAHFLRCIRTGETPCSSIEDGITVLRMLCALYESAEQGRSAAI